MAKVLEPTSTISDPRDKTKSISNVYAIVDQSDGDKSRRKQFIVFTLYTRACTKEERRSEVVLPILTYRYTPTEQEFETFFSPNALIQYGNPYKASYVWISQLKDINGELVWGSWIDDEM